MEIEFPDSKKKVVLEDVSFVNTTLIRGQYEKNFPNKPVVPTIQIQDATEPNPKDEKYVAALAQWQTKLEQAQWAAVKLYYAACVTNTNSDAVKKYISKVSAFIDLPATIREGYADLGVPFDEALMEPYIWLFHICITNASEQSLFQDAVLSGSAAAQEAVRSAIFRFGSKVQR